MPDVIETEPLPDVDRETIEEPSDSPPDPLPDVDDVDAEGICISFTDSPLSEPDWTRIDDPDATL